MCNNLQGTLHFSRTWALLKGLADPVQSSQQQKHNVNKIIHNFPGREEQLKTALVDKYLQNPTRTGPQAYTYSDDANPALTRPIMEADIRRALAEITKSTTPGKDGITCKYSKMTDLYVRALAHYYNSHWEEGHRNGGSTQK